MRLRSRQTWLKSRRTCSPMLRQRLIWHHRSHRAALGRGRCLGDGGPALLCEWCAHAQKHHVCQKGDRRQTLLKTPQLCKRVVRSCLISSRAHGLLLHLQHPCKYAGVGSFQLSAHHAQTFLLELNTAASVLEWPSRRLCYVHRNEAGLCSSTGRVLQHQHHDHLHNAPPRPGFTRAQHSAGEASLFIMRLQLFASQGQCLHASKRPMLSSYHKPFRPSSSDGAGSEGSVLEGLRYQDGQSLRMHRFRWARLHHLGASQHRGLTLRHHHQRLCLQQPQARTSSCPCQVWPRSCLQIFRLEQCHLSSTQAPELLLQPPI